MRKIEINGEVHNITDCHNLGYDEPGYLITLENNQEWHVFQDNESAGKAAREYWVNMAENDQQEFVCLVGEKNLVEWALGNYAGPGNGQVNSLKKWFDLCADHPEEQWASYDGNETECRMNKHAQESLGFNHEVVCYRCN